MKTIKITKDVNVESFNIFNESKEVQKKLFEVMKDTEYYINGVLNYGGEDCFDLCNDMCQDENSIYVPLHMHQEAEWDGDRYHNITDIYRELVSKVQLEAWCDVMANKN